MKKTVTIIFFIAITGLIGCKDGEIDKKNNKNLQGTWEVQSVSNIGYKNDVEIYRYKDENKANFNLYVFDKGKFILKYNGGGSEEYPYTLTGETLNVDNGYNIEHTQLKFNTATQIILRNEDNYELAGTTKRITEFILNKK